MDTIDRESVIECYRNRIEELEGIVARVEILPEAWQTHQSDAAKDFWNWETTIEPKSVEDCINELKAALRSIK